MAEIADNPVNLHELFTDHVVSLGLSEMGRCILCHDPVCSGACHSYDLTMSSFEESMDKLGLDYLDLFLIHWPNPIHFRDNWEQANAESWKAMEELVDAGRIRAIGVSNFLPHHLEALAKTARIAPQVNQIRLCPGDTADETVAYCRDHQILIEAYSPLGTGRIFDVPEMQALAEKYDRTIAQICVRWSL